MKNQEEIRNEILKDKKVKLHHNKLFNAIFNLDHDKLKLAIENILTIDKSYITKSWNNSNGFSYPNTPIFLAVCKDNLEAVRMLLNTDLVDPNIVEEGLSLMGMACLVGNEKVINLLLAHKANTNTYDAGRSGLMTLITRPLTNSLIYNGQWGDLRLRRSLINWYEKSKDFEPITSPIRCTWKGSLNAVEMLLEAGSSPHISNDENISPIKFLENPSDISCRFLVFGEQVSKIGTKFISGNNDILTYEMGIVRRDGSSSIKVTVDYDVRELRQLVKKYAEKNKVRDAMQQKLDELSDKTQEIVEEHKGKKEHERRIEEIYKNPGKKVFYELLSVELNSFLHACKVLSTDMVERSRNTKRDKASKFISFLSDSIPMGLGTPVKLINAIFAKLTDSKEARKHSKISRLVGMEHKELCENVALQITERFQKELSEIVTEKSAEDIAKKALGVIFAYMAGDEVEKVDGELDEAIAKDVIGSKYFKEALEKQLKKQYDQQQKQIDKKKKLDEKQKEKQEKPGEKQKEKQKKLDDKQKQHNGQQQAQRDLQTQQLLFSSEAVEFVIDTQRDRKSRSTEKQQDRDLVERKDRAERKVRMDGKSDGKTMTDGKVSMDSKGDGKVRMDVKTDGKSDGKAMTDGKASMDSKADGKVRMDGKTAMAAKAMKLDGRSTDGVSADGMSIAVKYGTTDLAAKLEAASKLHDSMKMRNDGLEGSSVLHFKGVADIVDDGADEAEDATNEGTEARKRKDKCILM